jgi:4-hydroxy-3-polyprenylbenzoate decarboxylase
MKLVVGITGASGVQYGIAVLELLQETNVESHLVISSRGEQVMGIETDSSPDRVRDLADVTYTPRDTTAAIASGSADFDGMLVCPCSMKSLGYIANGLGDGLIPRAAGVSLKEGRDLVLVTREAPLARTHVQNMLAATDAGATILPASPGFYTEPESLEELVDTFAAKVLDAFDVSTPALERWEGP